MDSLFVHTKTPRGVTGADPWAEFWDFFPFGLGALLFVGLIVGMAVRKRFSLEIVVLLVGAFFGPFDFRPSIKLFWGAAHPPKGWPVEWQGDEKYLAFTALAWLALTLYGIYTAFVKVWKPEGIVYTIIDEP